VTRRRVFRSAISFAALLVVYTPRLPAQSARASDTVALHVSDQSRSRLVRNATQTIRLVGSAPEHEFGDIRCLAALPNGGVVVFDAKDRDGPVLLVLGRDGKLIRRLGRAGSGPGEFSSSPVPGCLAISMRGTILMIDQGNGRVNRWSSDGKVLPAFVGYSPRGMQPFLIPGPDESVYIKISLPPPSGQAEMRGPSFGFVRLDARGRVGDTVRMGASRLRTPHVRVLDPVDVVSPTPSGAVLVGTTDRLGFVLSQRFPAAPLGTLVDAPPIPFSSAERAFDEAMRKWTIQQWGGSTQHPGYAEVKPAFYGVAFSVDGTIWLQQSATALREPKRALIGASKFKVPPPEQEYFEPPVFAVFTAKAVFVAEVHFPARLFPWNGSFGSDVAWVAEEENGLPVLSQWTWKSTKAGH